MKKLPAARNANLVIQNLEKELLIYDLEAHRAFGLNETASLVYQACGEKLNFDELKKKYKLTDEIVFLALDTLKENNLLADDGAYDSPFKGISRREIIRKVGLASMIALPVIFSIVAPTSAHAASGTNFPNGTACTASSQCKTGSSCVQTRNETVVAGGNSGSLGSPQCCLNTTSTITEYQGTYTRGSTTSGNCNFSFFCCTGTGSESIDPVSGKYDCTCDATS